MNRLKPATGRRECTQINDGLICVLFDFIPHSIQHLFLLLSSAHRRQSACPLQHPNLGRKHEPVCLWVHRMDTCLHVLHDIIPAKHEKETAERTILFHARKKITGLCSPPHNESVEISSQCAMTPSCLAVKWLLKQIAFYIIHHISVKGVFTLWAWLKLCSPHVNIVHPRPAWSKKSDSRLVRNSTMMSALRVCDLTNVRPLARAQTLKAESTRESTV